MNHYRTYGNAPYTIVCVHGGPGAPGTMKSLAETLAKRHNVLEPFQSKGTIEGQITELKELVQASCELPVTLVGHSWGAWLVYLMASRYPEIVKKIILIGAGSFKAHYVEEMKNTRKQILTDEENQRVSELFSKINDPDSENREGALAEFGVLMEKADSYDLVETVNEVLDFQPNVFNSCMAEINEMRNNGKLFEIGRNIECPVIAIHGKEDPHSYKGVEEPLSVTIADFKFVLLEKCGHTPWKEKHAQNAFYDVLEKLFI